VSNPAPRNASSACWKRTGSPACRRQSSAWATTPGAATAPVTVDANTQRGGLKRTRAAAPASGSPCDSRPRSAGSLYRLFGAEQVETDVPVRGKESVID
jgi:hypothetical protein